MPEIITGISSPNYPSITLQTRTGKGITNEQVNIPLDLWDLNGAEVIKREHPFATYRIGPCGYYNCHGLTFASRRTRIFDSNDIQRIINDDNYKSVEEKDVSPGDIVLYYQKGDPRHSGIVVEVPMPENRVSQIRVVSKWGHGHEVVHAVRDCPYSPCDLLVYYRVQSVCHAGRL